MSRVDFDNVVVPLAPALWYKFDEVSGDAINYGFVNNADATIVNGTYQQPGLLGEQDAVVFNNTGYAYVPFDAHWATFTEFTWVFVMEYLGPTTNQFHVSRLLNRSGGTVIIRDETLHTLYFGMRSMLENDAGPEAFDNVGAGMKTNLDYPEDSTRNVYAFTYSDSVDRRPRIYKNGTPVRATKNLQRPTFSDTVNLVLSPSVVSGIHYANVEGTYFGKNGSGPNGSHIAFDEILLFDKVLTSEDHRNIAEALGL